MIRLVALLGLFSACSCSKKDDVAQAPAPAPVPTSPGPTAKAPPPVDDPSFHLKPEEGTLTIAKAEAKAGSEATATIKVTPAAGYHMSTDFPIKITLDAIDGVKLVKTEYTAGKGQKGDADAFSEQALGFSVKCTPEKPGSYELKGLFKFGVCDKDSCHPKRQPITIAVAGS